MTGGKEVYFDGDEVEDYSAEEEKQDVDTFEVLAGL